MVETQVERLKAELRKLRVRIQQNRAPAAELSEEDTKQRLINPLLRALGWDLEDDIRYEYKHPPYPDPVDYALFLASSPALIIEAKSLEDDLGGEKWADQVLKYAKLADVAWCVLTNGDKYKIFMTKTPGAAEDKLFRVISISDENQEALTLETLHLLTKEKVEKKVLENIWNAHCVDRAVKKAVAELFEGPDKRLVNLIRKITQHKVTRADIQESICRAKLQFEYPVAIVPPATDQRPATTTRRPSGRQKASKTRHMPGVQVSDLIREGLIIPPLTLEKKYRKARVKATVEHDGTVTFDGKSYDSLSTAAFMARKSVMPDLKSTQTNGWVFWQYREAQTGKLKYIHALRQKYLNRPGKTYP